MKQFTFLLFLVILIFGCQDNQKNEIEIITSDIDLFWNAYDKVTGTTDTIEQAKYLKELFFDKGSVGLDSIIQARNYTAKEYLDAINNYPRFWNSVRENTYKSKVVSKELKAGVDKLRNIYPELRPAKIYFTIGALRTPGTAVDSLVLIGSELAMTDENTVAEEFPDETRAGRRLYFDSNPIDALVLLNVHEFVHTQQAPLVYNLLSECLYEGVAEFISVKAMNVPSNVPAIEFGKKNEDEVRSKFETDMFKNNKTYEWIWGDAENEFGVRDLGYYIGYEISERYYESSENKALAIKEIIELDYTNEAEVEAFVDGTGFLSNTLANLYSDFEQKRPKVISIRPFENGSQNVDPTISEITIDFSENLDIQFKSTGLGELGRGHFPKVHSIDFLEDGKSVQYKVSLEPNKRYQILLENGYRASENNPLKPYLIDFHTAQE